MGKSDISARLVNRRLRDLKLRGETIINQINSERTYRIPLCSNYDELRIKVGQS